MCIPKKSEQGSAGSSKHGTRKGRGDDSPFGNTRNGSSGTAATLLEQFRTGKIPEESGDGKKVKKPSMENGNVHSSFKNTKNKQQILQQVSIWVNRVLDMGAPSLVAEFRQLRRWVPENVTTNAFAANRPLNRYMDVPCQDARRVILKWPGIDNDYIHANYVATPSKDNHFICTQGPLVTTMQAFWAMVIQEKAEYVVMLCNTVECDKNKCEQYWPLNVDDVMVFGEDNDGKITVTNLDVSPMSKEDHFVRVSKLKLEYKEFGQDTFKIITHYQWENWPDRGVPATKFTAINLLAKLRDSTGPIIVHCSAGIGRTGTIVAISYVTEKMQNGEECLAMSELVKEIRTQRLYSIQNEYQYLYVHRVLLAYFLEKYRSRFEHILENGGAEKYQKWCADYKKATGCD
uniref:Protein-tyrosine phosphatase domain containing protein n=1 Tax=Haemonchus contortus TaxID=6289 RepID=A0A7I4Z111_HAECO